MSFPLTYRDAIHQLAELAQPERPAHTQLQALTTLIRELSPSNPRHEQVARALKPPPSPDPACPEAPLTAQQQTDFHLHPVAADLATPAPGQDLPPDDDSPEEEDDPW